MIFSARSNQRWWKQLLINRVHVNKTAFSFFSEESCENVGNACVLFAEMDHSNVLLIHIFNKLVLNKMKNNINEALIRRKIFHKS
jgi:hypothetical protein